MAGLVGQIQAGLGALGTAALGGDGTVGITGGYVPAYNNLGTNNGETRADPSRWNARRDSAVRDRY